MGLSPVVGNLSADAGLGSPARKGRAGSLSGKKKKPKKRSSAEAATSAGNFGTHRTLGSMDNAFPSDKVHPLSQRKFFNGGGGSTEEEEGEERPRKVKKS